VAGGERSPSAGLSVIGPVIGESRPRLGRNGPGRASVARSFEKAPDVFAEDRVIIAPLQDAEAPAPTAPQGVFLDLLSDGELVLGRQQVAPVFSVTVESGGDRDDVMGRRALKRSFDLL